MINLNVGINSTGYGCVATNVFKSLWNKSDETTLFPIGAIYLNDNSMATDITKAIKNQDRFDPNLPSLKIWHQHDLASRYSNRLNSALTFFELDSLTDREVAHINSLDLLFVASKWAKDVVDAQCQVDCKVLTMGVDTSIFKSQQPLQDSTYRFFTTGKTEVRKGHDVLVDLFCEAFEPTDDVELYIKWDNPFLSAEEKKSWEDLYAKSKMGDKIFFATSSSQKSVASIISQCDCGIFPFRAEGFGLGILEAIACNKPVISTFYSAPTEFLTDDNSFTVTPKSICPAYDGKWFFGDYGWADIDTDMRNEFVSHMRGCYKNKTKGNPGRDETVKKFSWDLCLDQLTNFLDLK